MLTPLAALERLLVAVRIGALIGLDHERAEARKSPQVFAGVRTFPLIALAGAVPMLVFELTGPSLLIVSFLTVITVTIISYVRTSASSTVGATTEIAAVTVAVVTNTLVKLGIAVFAGAGKFRWYVGGALAVMAVVTAIVGVVVCIRF